VTVHTPDHCSQCAPAVSPQTPLTPLVRRSRCCNAPILHPNPMNKRLPAALALVCTRCHRAVHIFNVITRDGFIIWPVPKWFKPPKRTKLNDLGKLFT
jgi:hypothetical protein